jgi:hypothetical protein
MKTPPAAAPMPGLWWPHLQQEARPPARGQTKRRSAMKRLSLVAALVSGALLAGCARFQHQASEPEPHGLINVAEYSSASRDHGAVARIDGIPVRAGREYRVVPGEHRVTVLFLEPEVKTYNRVGVSLVSKAPRTRRTGLRHRMATSPQAARAGIPSDCSPPPTPPSSCAPGTSTSPSRSSPVGTMTWTGTT